MIAFDNKPENKISILAQLQAHHDADEIIKGRYWEKGKGCAVGCTIHSGRHVEYETRFGIPQMLARLEDTIFEGLPNARAKTWPIEFMSAVQPGADLSRVGWKFLHWILTDEKVNPGINHPLVRDAVRRCADVLIPLTKGGAVDLKSASAAESAAWSAARAAAESAARAAAESAWSAAESAADSARAAAESAADSARAAAESAAESAWSAAWSAAYILMADKLLELISAEVRS